MQAISKAQKCAPRADPSPDFCFAFLSLFGGEFRSSRASYKRALSKKGSHDSALIMEIVEFIQQTLEAYPDKFQLHFALGLLNQEILDRLRAEEEYRLFIKKAKGDPYYSKFVDEAKKRLEKLNSKI